MVLKQPCCKVFTFFFSIGFDLTLIGMGFCVVGCGLIYMMEYCGDAEGFWIFCVFCLYAEIGFSV